MHWIDVAIMVLYLVGMGGLFLVATVAMAGAEDAARDTVRLVGWSGP